MFKKTRISTPRAAATRQRMREQGMRPIQIWVPDTRSKNFKAEARRQSILLRDDPHEKEILDWIEENADTSGWVGQD